MRKKGFQNKHHCESRRAADCEGKEGEQEHGRSEGKGGSMVESTTGKLHPRNLNKILTMTTPDDTSVWKGGKSCKASPLHEELQGINGC